MIPPEDRETFDPITVDAATWELAAGPARVETAADAWRRAAKAAAACGDELADGSRTVLGSAWEGAARDTFGQHQSKLVASLDAAQAYGEKLAGDLDAVAGMIRTCQGSLDAERDALAAKVPVSWDAASSSGGGRGTFRPRTQAEADAVHAAVASAGVLRTDLDKALSGRLGAFATGDWDAISAQWDAVAEGTSIPFAMPAEATGGVSVIMVDGRIVVNTGAGDDKVKVTVDPKTGMTVVEVNGAAYYYAAGTPVTIRGGDGNDTIEIPKGTNLSVTLLGGAGDDVIRGGDGGETILGGHGKDDIYGGSGDDYVSGGSGIDYIDAQGGDDTVSGGSGNDTLYGLGGDDYLTGGTGDDYLEGATGDDTLQGGAGDDTLSGGRDNDTITGGTGDDVAYGGHGKDTITAGGGSDTAYRQDEDTVNGVKQDVRVEISDAAQFIKIEGSDEFKERVLADLDMYRASPTGQQMLQNLQDNRDPNAWFGENTLTIRELHDENGYANSGGGVFNSDSTIDYNPGFTFDSERGRPSVVLYHELGHVYDYWNDTFQSEEIDGGPDDGIKKGERQAAGLPFDHDGDPSTPDRLDPDHPIQYTENGLRDEMNMPTRDTYRTYSGDGW